MSPRLQYFAEALYASGRTGAIIFEADASETFAETARKIELACLRIGAKPLQLFCLDYWGCAVLAPLEIAEPRTH